MPRAASTQPSSTRRERSAAGVDGVVVVVDGVVVVATDGVGDTEDDELAQLEFAHSGCPMNVNVIHDVIIG